MTHSETRSRCTVTDQLFGIAKQALEFFQVTDMALTISEVSLRDRRSNFSFLISVLLITHFSREPVKIIPSHKKFT